MKTKIKVIFLDIDGVLITHNSKKQKFDKDCVKNLNYILEKSNAYIVLSSAWRLNFKTNNEIFNWFLENGIKINKEKVLGKTNNKTFPETENSKRRDNERGWQIHSFIKEFNKNNQKYRINNFIIIDDDYDKYLFKKNWFLIKNYVNGVYCLEGLKKHHINGILEILNKHNK